MLVLKVVFNNRLIIISKHFFPNLNLLCRNCHKKNQPEKKIVDTKYDNEKEGFPEEPTTCCMSGCANCVWLEYAEKITQMCRDQGDEALKRVSEKVSDPNMKAFLLSELRMKNVK